MFNPASPLAALMDAQVRPGRVVWIGLRPARHAAMLPVAWAMADPAAGLSGDRYATPGGKRQLTLIGQEDLAAIASYIGVGAIPPETVRRNLVVAGLNLLALKGRQLRVGTALLAVTDECHPCSRMEAALGPGGYNAVRGHGGITASVVEPGEIRLGDIAMRL